MMKETENQTRLRRLKESMAMLKEAENNARKVLADTIESSKRVKEKYEELFLKEENEERIRKTKSYYHDTK